MATITGTSGNDNIMGTSSADNISGAAGNDIINGAAGNDYIRGGKGNDDIRGGQGDDQILGDLDDDYIRGDYGNDRLYGGDGADRIYGGADNDYLYGEAGADYLYGEDGTDYLYGGADNDYANGGEGNDVVNGDDGNDQLYGGNGADNMDGGTGDDVIYGANGGAGDVDGGDYITGGTGNDFINGQAGNDNLYGGIGNDTVKGGQDQDQIYGDAGNDSLTGDAGNDTVYGGDGSDIIEGNDGNDTLYGANGAQGEADAADQMSGGAGDDFVSGQIGNDNINGDDGNDTLQGGQDQDTISGGTGNDWILGNDGLDVIKGDAGNDTIEGGAHDDNIDGGADNDLIFGEGGDDTVTGGDGDDQVYGARGQPDELDGNDSLNGGAGNDFVSGQMGNDTVDGGAGNDTVRGGQDQDIVRGGDGDDWVLGDDGLDTVEGNNGNDTLEGGAHDDTVSGGEGSDYVLGQDGNDLGYGGNGTDTLMGGEGNDTLYGANNVAGEVDGNDVIYGENGNDYVNGQAGNDTVFGDAGADIVRGGQGDDIAHGGDGEDLVQGDAGNDTLYGDAGYDTVEGGDGDDQIFGGAHADTLIGGAGNDNLYGANNIAGEDDWDDVISGGDGNDYANGQMGNDSIMGDAGNDTLRGGQNNDTLNGGEDNDFIQGDTGDDVGYGGNGADSILGGEGNDSLHGANNVQGEVDGNDTIHGEAGNDLVSGQLGDDSLTGDAGDDTVQGGQGNDVAEGGEGNDTVLGNLGNDSLQGNAGNDMLYGGEGNDSIQGGQDQDYIEGNEGDDTLKGNLGLDTIYGNTGNDYIDGGDHNDLLRGGQGDDTVIGGTGEDTLYGDKGNDTTTGGGGEDLFVLRADDGSDVITDFEQNTWHEKVDIRQVLNAASFDELTITQSGSNAILDLGNGQTLTLENVNADLLNSTDFLGAWSAHKSMNIFKVGARFDHLPENVVNGAVAQDIQHYVIDKLVMDNTNNVDLYKAFNLVDISSFGVSSIESLNLHEVNGNTVANLGLGRTLEIRGITPEQLGQANFILSEAQGGTYQNTISQLLVDWKQGQDVINFTQNLDAHKVIQVNGDVQYITNPLSVDFTNYTVGLSGLNLKLFDVELGTNGSLRVADGFSVNNPTHLLNLKDLGITYKDQVGLQQVGKDTLLNIGQGQSILLKDTQADKVADHIVGLSDRPEPQLLGSYKVYNVSADKLAGYDTKTFVIDDINGSAENVILLGGEFGDTLSAEQVHEEGGYAIADLGNGYELKFKGSVAELNQALNKDFFAIENPQNVYISTDLHNFESLANTVELDPENFRVVPNTFNFYKESQAHNTDYYPGLSWMTGAMDANGAWVSKLADISSDIPGGANIGSPWLKVLGGIFSIPAAGINVTADFTGEIKDGDSVGKATFVTATNLSGSYLASFTSAGAAGWLSAGLLAAGTIGAGGAIAIIGGTVLAANYFYSAVLSDSVKDNARVTYDLFKEVYESAKQDIQEAWDNSSIEASLGRPEENQGTSGTLGFAWESYNWSADNGNPDYLLLDKSSLDDMIRATAGVVDIGEYQDYLSNNPFQQFIDSLPEGGFGIYDGQLYQRQGNALIEINSPYHDDEIYGEQSEDDLRGGPGNDAIVSHTIDIGAFLEQQVTAVINDIQSGLEGGESNYLASLLTSITLGQGVDEAVKNLGEGIASMMAAQLADTALNQNISHIGNTLGIVQPMVNQFADALALHLAGKALTGHLDLDTVGTDVAFFAANYGVDAALTATVGALGESIFGASWAVNSFLAGQAAIDAGIASAADVAAGTWSLPIASIFGATAGVPPLLIGTAIAVATALIVNQFGDEIAHVTEEIGDILEGVWHFIGDPINGIEDFFSGLFDDKWSNFAGTSTDDAMHHDGDHQRTNLGGGDDVFFGADEWNVVFGEAGNDVIFGGAGNDNRTDELFGGSGDDYINGKGGPNKMLGGAGNDYIVGGNGSDTIWGDDNPDEYYEAGRNTGVAGNDTIVSNAGNDTIYTGGGNDLVVVKAATKDVDTVKDFDAAKDGVYLDTNTSTAIAYAENGNTIIALGDGQRLVMEGVAPENLTAQNFGGNVSEILIGSVTETATKQVVNAGPHQIVTTKAGTANLSVTTGNGNDEINASASSGHNTLKGDSGMDTIFGGSGDDEIYGANGVLNESDGNDKLYGGAGNDYVNGQIGDDTVLGEAGDDALYGGKGDDQIDGGDGNDYLVGNLDDDTLTGGEGEDIFAFRAGDGMDVITDFNTEADFIKFVQMFQNVEQALATLRYDTDRAIFDFADGNQVELLGVTSGITNSHIIIGSEV